MQTNELKALVIDALEDLKAVNIETIDVSGHSSMVDFMVVASGNSRRHVSSVADNVVTKAKQAGMQPLGVEGADAGEWVLVDLGDVVVNVMMPDTREFYGLEKLWSNPPTSDADQGE